jgi:hypothetical protein
MEFNLPGGFEAAGDELKIDRVPATPSGLIAVGPLRRRKIASEHREDIMKAATVVGILLIVLGIVGFALGGISFTHEKKVVDMGPVQLSHKETDTLPLSPILSTVSLLAGVGLVVVGVRSK